MLSHSNTKRKSKKGLRIFFCIIATIVIVSGILFAVNFKTVMLFTGHGSASINSLKDIKTSLANSDCYKNVKSTVDSSGSTVITGKSKDNAISYIITQQKSGKKSVNTDINLKKLQVKGLSKSAIFNGSFSSIQKLKAQADQYIEPIVGKGQTLGIEAFLTEKIIEQSKTSNKIKIRHTFGNVTIILSADLRTDKANVKITS